MVVLSDIYATSNQNFYFNRDFPEVGCVINYNSIMPKLRSGVPPQSLKTRPRTAKSRASSSLRARHLVDSLLREMQEGIRNPSYCESEAWEKLFGSKDSFVVNLQKLVATLAARPDEVKPELNQQRLEEPITSEEMVLLKAWLEDSKPSGL